MVEEKRWWFGRQPETLPHLSVPQRAVNEGDIEFVQKKGQRGAKGMKVLLDEVAVAPNVPG